MPAELDACVAELMADGHDESSAFAICRSRLGVKDMSKKRLQDEEEEDREAQEDEDEEEDEDSTEAQEEDEDEEEDEDGAQEDEPPPKDEEEEGPEGALVKTVTIAHTGRNFMNGDEPFNLTRANIDEIIENFKKLKPQVPILLDMVEGPDHVFGGDRGGMPSFGWVNSLERRGKDFIANIKFLGPVAEMVKADQFRGISIGTKPGRDLQGNNIGHVLDHLLVTNAGFFSDLNIAASARRKAGTEGLIYWTSRPQRKKMAKLTKAQKDRVSNKPRPSYTDVGALKDENIGLRRRVLRLEDELTDAKTAARNSGFDEKYERQELRLKKLERRDRANTVLRLLDAGLSEGRLKPSQHTGFNRDDLEDILKWFKASHYDGNLALLEFARMHNEPRTRLNREYQAGEPRPAGSLHMPAETEQELQGQGIDTSTVKLTAGVRNIEEYKALVAKRKGA